MICFEQYGGGGGKLHLSAAFLEALNGGDLGAWGPLFTAHGVPVQYQPLWQALGSPVSGIKDIWKSVPECYRRAAQASAREMMLERDEIRKLLGWRPLTVAEKSALQQWDAGLSLHLFTRMDAAERQGLLPPSKVEELGPDDPQPYPPEELDVASYLRAERIAGRRKKLAEAIIGGDAGQYSDIVREQLENQIPVDPLYPVIGPENRDFAAEQDPDRAARLAMRQARDIDMQAIALETRNLQTAAQARSWWEGNYPRVELRAEDNPHVDGGLLAKDWWSNKFPLDTLLNPPTVKVLVTPRQKPVPKLGFLGGIGGTILSSVIGLIPVVGTAASLAMSHAQKSEQKSWMGAVMNGIPQSVFAPQYFPQSFYIALPLDEAQAAVKQPSFVPALAWRFRDQTNGLANPFE